MKSPAQQSNAEWLADYDAPKVYSTAQRKKRKQETQDKEQGWEAAAVEAAKLVHESQWDATPYKRRKGITIPCRAIGQNLILPMYHDGRLVNVQTIKPEKYKGNDKWFITGGLTKDCYHAIGDQNAETLVYGEGFATVALAHQATGHSAIVTFNAQNLGNATPPETCKTLIIAADNDKSGVGGAAAKKLADRLSIERPELSVMIMMPPRIASDWADYPEAEIIELWKTPIFKSIHDKFLDKSLFDTAKHLCIRSETSTGKSYATRQWSDDDPEQRIIYIVPSMALARDATEDGYTCYLDSLGNLKDQKRLSICIDSVSKLDGYDASNTTIILDECETLGHSINKTDFTLDRIKTVGVLGNLLNNCKKSIWLDADAGIVTDELAKMAGITLTRVVNNYPTMKEVDVNFRSESVITERMNADLAAGKPVACFCSCVAEVEAMQKKYGGVAITGNTPSSVKDAFIKKVKSGDRITENLFFNTAVATGVSIENHAFDTMYCKIKPGHMMPSMLDSLQGSRRLRWVKEIVVYVSPYSVKNELPTNADEIIEKDLTKPEEYESEYISEFIRTEPFKRIFDPLIVGLYAASKSSKNEQLNNPHQFLIDRFKRAGATVSVSNNATVSCAETKSELKLIKEAIKEKLCREADQVETPTLNDYLTGDVEGVVETALAEATHGLNLSDADARQVAIKDIQEPGYIKRVKHGIYTSRDQSEIINDDMIIRRSKDMHDKTRAARISLEDEFLMLSGALEPGAEFTPSEITRRCSGWLKKYAVKYTSITRRKKGLPKQANRFLLELLKARGMDTTHRKSAGDKVYQVSESSMSGTVLNRHRVKLTNSTTKNRNGVPMRFKSKNRVKVPIVKRNTTPSTLAAVA